MNTQRLADVQSTMMKKDPSLNPDQHNHEPKPNLLRDAGPDLGLLKLASPDLERLIIQSSGLVAAGNPNLQFGYPKSASEEQEFAEGFVKALEDLHKQNQLSASADRMDLLGSAGLQPCDLPVYTTLNGYSEAPPAPASVSPFPPPGPLKDEPQTVPDVQTFGDSPPLSPIDMDSQERIKAERKKLRNRIAASKCRKRKLERISRLEEKVRSLKNQNSELESTASGLRDQVARLKQKVLSHVSSGCQLMPNQVQVY